MTQLFVVVVQTCEFVVFRKIAGSDTTVCAAAGTSADVLHSCPPGEPKAARRRGEARGAAAVDQAAAAGHPAHAAALWLPEMRDRPQRRLLLRRRPRRLGHGRPGGRQDTHDQEGVGAGARRAQRERRRPHEVQARRRLRHLRQRRGAVHEPRASQQWRRLARRGGEAPGGGAEAEGGARAGAARAGDALQRQGLRVGRSRCLRRHRDGAQPQRPARRLCAV